MKLADFLYQNSMTPSELRRILGVKCRSTIWRYLMDERMPRPDLLERIESVTDGRVRKMDFSDPRPPRCARIVVDGNGETRIVLPWSEGWNAHAREFPETHFSRLSPPVKRALSVLGGRGWYTPRGSFLLDGRMSDLRRIMRAANDELKRHGEPPIPYPGVEPIDD